MAQQRHQQQQRQQQRQEQHRAHHAATANLQLASPLFASLPCEIRQKIYQELWDALETRWHVHSIGDGLAPVPVFPCILADDELDEDVRYAQFQTTSGRDEALVWETRLKSPWNTHWRCAEAAAVRLSRVGSMRNRRVAMSDYIRSRPDFTSPLLVCKRMYLESVEVLENALTFCFTDLLVARDFLARHAPHRTLKNVVLSLRLKPLLTELYYPDPQNGGLPPPSVGGLPVTAAKNPWEDLCHLLCALASNGPLRRAHVRLDSEDLRPWHKRVNERALFASLLTMRTTARRFTLSLPDIPVECERDCGGGVLAGQFLTGELKEAPFDVKRGPRPNNWQIHLSRISHVLPETWGHNLWNQVQEKVLAATS